MTQSPMTSDEFFDIFRAYNEAVGPAPVILTLLAVFAAYRAFRSKGSRDGVVTVVLAGLWAWSGIAYQILHHAPYNSVAYVFGALFLVQAGALLWAGPGSQELRFRARPDRFGITGAGMMAYGLVVYPLIGYALGHRYPEAPTFGAPCPVTIFTFGLLLWTAGKVPWYVLLVPFLWAIVAVGAAVNWGVLEDLAMPVAAVVSSGLLLHRNMRLRDGRVGRGLVHGPRRTHEQAAG